MGMGLILMLFDGDPIQWLKAILQCLMLPITIKSLCLIGNLIEDIFRRPLSNLSVRGNFSRLTPSAKSVVSPHCQCQPGRCVCVLSVRHRK